MDFDDISLNAFEELKKEWINRCSKSSKGICELAGRYRKRDDCFLRSMHAGRSTSASVFTGMMGRRLVDSIPAAGKIHVLFREGVGRSYFDEVH